MATTKSLGGKSKRKPRKAVTKPYTATPARTRRVRCGTGTITVDGVCTPAKSALIRGNHPSSKKKRPLDNYADTLSMLTSATVFDDPARDYCASVIGRTNDYRRDDIGAENVSLIIFSRTR